MDIVNKGIAHGYDTNANVVPFYKILTCMHVSSKWNICIFQACDGTSHVV